MDLPTELTEPDLTSIYGNDTTPSNIDPSTISYVGEYLSAPLALFVPNSLTTAGYPDNGAGVSSYAKIFNPVGDQRWMTVRTVIIRVSTEFAPAGRFPVYSNNSLAGGRIGYDVGVCVQMCEPWIIETYNASVVSTSALRIVGRGDGSTLLSPGGNIRGVPIANTRYLNTTGKINVFVEAHMNSETRMGEGDDLGRMYGPSPGVGP